MTERKKLFIGRFVYPLAVALTLFLSSGIYSLLDGKKFLYQIKKINHLQWIVVIITAAILYFFYKRYISYRRMKDLIELQRFPSVMYSNGRKHINSFTINCFGYEWLITSPEPSQFWTKDEDFNHIEPDSIRVKLPPRCPNCKTELLEDSRFFGGFIVRCPRNDFRTKSKSSFQELSYEVKLIMKNEIELQQK